MLSANDKKYIQGEIHHEAKETVKLLRKEMGEMRGELRKEMGEMKKELRQEMGEIKRELKEDILSFKDEILGEIRAMREELAMVIGYRQHIEDHDERIEKIEHHLGFSR